jgi:hypothetical protein
VVSTREDPALPLARLRAGGELVEVGPLTRASPPRRWRPTSTTSPGSSWPRATSPGSRGTTGTSSTTSSTRSWPGSQPTSAASFPRPPSWTGSAARCATPSPASPAARPCWSRWSGPTCSWSRSTTAAAGTAITTCSPTSCRPISWTSTPTGWRPLHRGASQWYERNGEPSQAIRHALAAGEVERAADLVELAIPALRRVRQEATIRSWLEALPGDLVGVPQGVYMGDFSPNVRPIPALRARVLAARGRVADALAWAREQGLSASDDLSYLREFESTSPWPGCCWPRQGRSTRRPRSRMRPGSFSACSGRPRRGGGREA